MDYVLAHRILKASGSKRNKLVVLIAGLSGLPVERVLNLTVLETTQILKTVKGQPFYKEAAQLVKDILHSVPKGTDLLHIPMFYSRNKAKNGDLKPIERGQGTRIVKQALAVVPGLVRTGFRALRKLWQIVRTWAPVDPIDFLIQSIGMDDEPQPVQKDNPLDKLCCLII